MKNFDGSRWPLKDTFAAMLRGLCPICRQGKIYASLVKMNERCPACALKFEREPGYFLGAMSVSYILGVPVLGLLIMLLSFSVFPEWPAYQVVLPAMLFFLPSIPYICQYSRIVWIYFDRWIDPETVEQNML